MSQSTSCSPLWAGCIISTVAFTEAKKPEWNYTVKRWTRARSRNRSRLRHRHSLFCTPKERWVILDVILRGPIRCTIHLCMRNPVSKIRETGSHQHTWKLSPHVEVRGSRFGYSFDNVENASRSKCSNLARRTMNYLPFIFINPGNIRSFPRFKNPDALIKKWYWMKVSLSGSTTID